MKQVVLASLLLCAVPALAQELPIVRVDVTPPEVSVGEPVTLTVTLEGRGNLKTATSPQLPELEMFKQFEPEITERAKSRDAVRNQQTLSNEAIRRAKINATE